MRLTALSAVVAITVLSLTQLLPARAADTTEEFVEGMCEYGGPPHPYDSSLEKSDQRVSFSGENFEATVDGEDASFRVVPASFAYGVSLRRIIIIPDSQTDVGAGPGVERSIRTSYGDGSWFLDGTYSPGAPPVNVKAVEDDNDDSEHQSTIRFAVECSSSVEEKIIELCTVLDIRIRYGDEEPPEANRGFRNSCAHERPNLKEAPPASPTPAPSQNSAVPTPGTSAPPTNPVLADLPGQDAYLNELEGYTKGEGEVLWLKPGEGAKFKINPTDTEAHSLRVKSLGDQNATLVVASDPIEFTLKYDETKRVDVDRQDGDDIEIAMLTITDGQAAIRVKPLTAAAAVSTVQVPASVKARQQAWPYIGAGAGAIGLGAAAWFGRKRLGFMRKITPSPSQKTKR